VQIIVACNGSFHIVTRAQSVSRWQIHSQLRLCQASFEPRLDSTELSAVNHDDPSFIVLTETKFSWLLAGTLPVQKQTGMMMLKFVVASKLPPVL
jgi:hypothetical protein